MAIKAEPIYPKSAPLAKAESTPWPVDIEPVNAIGPSYHSLISCIKAKGDNVPACPPAPAATNISPSTPASDAFSACLF